MRALPFNIYKSESFQRLSLKVQATDTLDAPARKHASRIRKLLPTMAHWTAQAGNLRLA